MTATEKITDQLMNYFACVAHAGQVFGPRDFNSQVLVYAFDPQERAALGTALQELVEAGVLRLTKPIEYTLTSDGFATARRLREGNRTAARGTVPVA